MASSTVERPLIDSARVTTLANGRVGNADFIARELAHRLLERLDLMRIAPTRILDAGCGDGADRAELGRRYPLAHLIGTDLAPGALARARAASRISLVRRLLGQTSHASWVRAELAHLPLPPRSVNLIVSNVALACHPDVGAVFAEWARVLDSEGLVLFSSYGPDTLKEVREAFAVISSHPHVLEFPDMHDIGDLLVSKGFANPVMDMENIILTYPTLAALWKDVRAMGGNLLAARFRGLLGRRASQRLLEAFDAHRGADGSYRLTIEAVYGHAWKGEPKRRPDEPVPIKFERKGRR